jgi:hypothetical protein
MTNETARALLHRHDLPEDIIDGALCLHAQELARQIREETARLKADGVLELDKFRPCRDAADQIDPTRTPAAAPAVVEPPADQTTADVRDQLLHAIDFNYAASLGYASPEELLAAYDTSRTPSTGQTTPSRRAGLRAELVDALGRITTVPPVAHRQEQADHVLAVLYREWPWLRAEAEDAAPADQTADRDRIAAATPRQDGAQP